MRIEQETRGKAAVLRISGEYDSLDVEVFESALAALIAGGRCRVVLDLEKLTFINSTALGTIIRGQERMAQAGGDLVCAKLSKFTERNFRLLGMDRRVRSFATVEEAIARLEEGGAGAPGAGDRRVGFRFPAEGPAGTERRAELLEIRPDGLAFRFDNVEGIDAAAAFAGGRELEFRFGGGPAGAGHAFRARGRVQSADPGPGGKVVVRASLDDVPAAERETVARLVRELGGPG